MSSTFVTEITRDSLGGTATTPCGNVGFVTGHAVEWLANEARFCSLNVDVLEKKLRETEQVLGDLLQEKLPLVYVIERHDSKERYTEVCGVYLDLEKAKLEAERLVGPERLEWKLLTTHTAGTHDYWSCGKNVYVEPFTVR